MIGFQVHPTTEMPGNLKNTKIRDGAIERLIQTFDAEEDSYEKIVSKKGVFNAFSGIHKGLVLLKDLPKPLMPNRTYMSENHFENTFTI